MPVELRGIHGSRRGSRHLAAGPLLLLSFLLLCFSSDAFHPASAHVDEDRNQNADDHQEHRLGKVVFVVVPPASHCVEIVLGSEVAFSISFGLSAFSCPLAGRYISARRSGCDIEFTRLHRIIIILVHLVNVLTVLLPLVEVFPSLPKVPGPVFQFIGLTVLFP